MANDSVDLLCIAPTPSSGAGTVALALALALGLDGAPEYRGALHACAHYSASPSASTARRSTEARPRACAHYSALHACAHYSAPEYRGAPNCSYFAPPSVQRIFPSSGSRGGGALVHVYGTALSTALVPADADAVMDETYVPDET